MARVLVAEDNPSVAKFYRLALERVGGFEVTCTEDVDEILRQVSERTADIAILDVSLRNSRYNGRNIDGLELARLIRSIPEGKDFPLLLATASAMEGDRQRLMAASGANDYLAKPIYDPQLLVDKVRELMAQ